MDQVTLWVQALHGMSSPYQVWGTSSNDMFLVRRIIKQDHVIEGTGYYKDKSSST